MIISHEDFIKLCRIKVAEFETQEGRSTTPDKVFVVWSAKVLQNSKCLLSTRLKGASYYECTMNGDQHEIYVDKYSKDLNQAYDTEGTPIERLER